MLSKVPKYVWIGGVVALVVLAVGAYYFFAIRGNDMSESKEKVVVINPDSLRWTVATTSAPWEARDSVESYEWNGKLYMIGGLDANGSTINGQPDYNKAKYFNDLWESADGVNWTLITEHTELPPMRSMSVAQINGKLYLYAGWGPTVGFNKDIWQSEDGIHWRKTGTKLPFPAREGQRVLPALGKLYVFGGVNYDMHKTLNDVWETSDGLNWKQLTVNAPWEGRWDYDATYFNNKFWVICGMTIGSNGFSDIWSSPDGITWTLEASETPLGLRQGHTVLVYKGVMWVIGGLDAKSNAGEGDTWWTRDGKEWHKVPVNGGWTGREDHQTHIFKDKLVLFTGMDTNWRWTNDIWVGSLESAGK